METEETLLEEKAFAVGSMIGPMVGKRLVRFETAQIMRDDGTWDNWYDLPIRLY